jgi:hypothetical protein
MGRRLEKGIGIRMKKDFANIYMIILFILLTIYTIIILCFQYIPIYKNRNLLITECFFTEDSIVIKINRSHVRLYHIQTVRIDYKNIPVHILFYMPNGIKVEEEWQNKNESKQTITLIWENIPTGIEILKEGEWLDGFQKNDILYINEEAELLIDISRGRIEGTIFINEDNIDILEQGFSFHH